DYAVLRSNSCGSSAGSAEILTPSFLILNFRRNPWTTPGIDHEHHDAHSRRPRWKRVHHSWIFRVAVFLMLLAMITYVMTGDLFWGLHGQSKTPPTPAPGR